MSPLPNNWLALPAVAGHDPKVKPNGSTGNWRGSFSARPVRMILV